MGGLRNFSPSVGLKSHYSALNQPLPTTVSVKTRLQDLLRAALQTLALDQHPAARHPQITPARAPQHGDYAANIALLLAKPAKQKPQALAEQLVAALPDSPWVARAEVAAPGFINFHLSPAVYHALPAQIREAGAHYGCRPQPTGERVLIEFVSANPTGPLHIGHGRGAAFGDTLARLLRAAGFTVDTEYYVNDAGRQMDILALSVWLRYLEQGGSAITFPDNAYRGDYVKDIAAQLREHTGDRLMRPAETLDADLPKDPENRLDTLITRCREALGPDNHAQLARYTLDAELRDIRADLSEFGVEFNQWFSEQSLVANGDIERALEALEARGHLYQQDGAQWFRATALGDSKDRVVRRANGQHTYFAADIAYHFNKGERGYDKLINLFGADHHGYITRIKTAFGALGHPADRLTVLLLQFVALTRAGKRLKMSTREGEFVTLRSLREEVGNDAARFFYLLRRPDQHLDFDVALATSESADNPVYYVQYAHARICSVMQKIRDRGLPAPDTDTPDPSLLTLPEEHALLGQLLRFPDLIEQAAEAYAPHQVAYYLRDLAAALHSYYNAHPFLASEPPLRLARLALIDAVRQVLANGLAILGVSSPLRM